MAYDDLSSTALRAKLELVEAEKAYREAQANFDRYTALERKIGEEPQNRFKIKAHLPFPWMWDIIRNDNILDAVEDIIGPDIL